MSHGQTRELGVFSHLWCGNSGLVMTGCEVRGRYVGRSPAVETHAHLPLPLCARNCTRWRVPWNYGFKLVFEKPRLMQISRKKKRSNLAKRSPDCWTREAGLEMACSGPFLTLLAAAGLGPGGRPRDADPLGPPPIRSSLSSPVLLSRSPSSAVRLAPW